MTHSAATLPRLAEGPEEPARGRGGSPVPAAAGVALCVLLAVAQVALAGYRLGVGNQSIQIAFLKHWADPSLYTQDQMVQWTLESYPTYFFRMLAPLLAYVPLERLYLALQILTSFLGFAAAYWLGRSIYRSHAAALAGTALLAAGHLQALAGDGLYSQGFTHTFAALPAAVAALALAYRGRWVWAFALAGLLFNVHALTSAYALLMLAAGMLADLWEGEAPAWRWMLRAGACIGVAGLLAAPTLWLMSGQRQVFDEQWINLMRVRSAEHSFPSSWWAENDPDVPRFALLFALFVLSWSFSPVRRPDVQRALRITVLMTLACALLFAVGYVFTEIWPSPLVIRLQPFRASRLMMVLMLIYIAHGAVAAMRAAVAGQAQGPEGQTHPLSRWQRVAEVGSGVLVLLTLGVPSLLGLLPITVAVVTGVALLSGRLSWRQALVAMAALQVSLLAYVQIHFPLLPAGLTWTAGDADALGWGALAMAAAMALLIALLQARRPRAVAIAVTTVAGVMLAYALFVRESSAPPAGEQAALADVADWARSHTRKEDVFLTPTGMGSFRLQAERGIVGDWRDGTQLYFSAAFAPEWRQRVTDIEPALKLSDDGSRLLARGRDLAELDDAQLLTLARTYGAQFILLRNALPGQSRLLATAFSGAQYTVYKAALQSIATAPVPPGVINPAEWNAMELFMNTTVAQNIEKYRKADVTLQLVDPVGRPAQDLPFAFEQTQQAFLFGASLGFFEPNNFMPNDDLKPGVVRPIELEKMPEIFNASMIPFSGKWQYIEPVRGMYRWSDLDKYVDYCTQHNVTMEFHHLTGTLPPWVVAMGGVAGQRGTNFGAPIPALQNEFNRHCRAVLERYGDRIQYFQVVNEKYMMQYVPSIFKELQANYPHVKFGLSDCVRFWSQSSNLLARDQEQYKGFDAIAWLNKQGIKPDFFSVHGHYPLDLWADPREMYAVFNRFEQAHVKVHCTEEYLQLAGPVYGPVRRGTWTPALQAEYLVRYLTVAFSHRNVELVNLWGLTPDGWGASNSGLIDGSGKPRPAWEALRKLFTETWRTHVSGTLGIDGTLRSRAFHGTYKLTVTLPDGRNASTVLTVPQQPEAKFRLVLDVQKGTLTAGP